MLHNLWGWHWANVPIDGDIANQALSMGGDCYLVIDGAWGAIPEIRKARPNAIIVNRHAVSNWMDMKAEEWAKQMADLFHQNKQHTKHVELECEPDIFPNFPGEGQPIIDRLKFAASWNLEVAKRLRELCPGVIIHSAPLAHERLELLHWFSIWKPLLDECDVLDMHCYWEKGQQYYRDGLYHPVHSRYHAFRYRLVHDFLESRNYHIPMMVTECGNFAPDRRDYADDIIYYFTEMGKDASYMMGGCLFILQSNVHNWINDIARRQPDLPEFFRKLRETSKPEYPYPKKEVAVRNDLPKPTDAKISVELTDLRSTTKRHPTLIYSRRSLTTIDTIVIHHTGTPSAKPETIAEFHVNERKYPGPGYHLYIRKDGSVYWMNSLEVVSTHCLNHNAHTIGICFEGSFIQGSLPTEEQYKSGKRLVKALTQPLSGRLPLRGHKQMSGNETNLCPGDLDISRLVESEDPEKQMFLDSLREIGKIVDEALSDQVE